MNRVEAALIPAAAATMAGSVRLFFGGWFLPAHGAALVVLGLMAVGARVIRRFARHLDPDGGGAVLMLGANLQRIGIGVLGTAVVHRTEVVDFRAFCTSTMVGYMYYLLAEIYHLVQESRRDIVTNHCK